MYGKIICTFVFLLFLLISFSIYIGTVDLRPYFFPLLPSPSGDSSRCAPPSSPLKVFMYDLPSKFHVAMLDPRSSDVVPLTAESLPGWPLKSGIKRQHSVEYWLMASLLDGGGSSGGGGGGGEEREAVRVLDPESADVFFVPFFSSLSFNTHGKNMLDPDTKFDRDLQVELVEFLWKSKYWQRSKGRDHVIPMTHPNAFRFLRQQVNASILIVVDFGRYPRNMSYLTKDVVSPYVHVVDSYLGDDPPHPFESRTTLLFFRGSTVRKDEGKIRAKLEKILGGYDDVHYQKSIATTKNIGMSTQGMRSSKFCLHPAGDTPSSCRLFDAIVSHCVPVIVSNRVELPFEDEIDYSEFSIFFSVKEALQPGFIVNELRRFPKDKWVKMWRRLKNISHHYEFQYPPKKEDGVNMLWKQVKHKVPNVKLEIHRSSRLKVSDWWRRRR